jgi:hypothetical protein
MDSTASLSEEEAVDVTDPTASRFRYEKIDILIGSPIPAGWVIVSTKGSYFTIANLAGAPYKATLKILALNALPRYNLFPAGWVITRVEGNGAWSTTVYTIRNLAGAPRGAQAKRLGISPHPAGWVIISREYLSSDRTPATTRYTIQKT